MSNAAFDVDVSMLSELDFTMTCELRKGRGSSERCDNEAKYHADIHHFSTGCRTKHEIICEKHMQAYLDFDQKIKMGACGICYKNNEAITNIVPL